MEGFFAIAEIIILASILFLTIYGVVLGYHWFTFGASRVKSTTAMLIYVIGSAIIILGMGISLTLM